VIFRQIHVPGKMGLSDFTDMNKHGVIPIGAMTDSQRIPKAPKV
jgi:hypothetical protein